MKSDLLKKAEHTNVYFKKSKALLILKSDTKILMPYK